LGYLFDLQKELVDVKSGDESQDEKSEMIAFGLG